MLDARLNHVVAAAQQGSFTAAARVVGVTQSAITKSIAELERQLGYLIFHRTSRGALLTVEGRVFVDRATRLLEDAKDLLRGPSAREDAYAGPLRIGVCPASLEWQLVEPATALLARHPSIRLDVSGAGFERVAQQLRNGDIDVALGFDEAFAERADFRREPLPAAPTVLFARKDHPLARHGYCSAPPTSPPTLRHPVGNPAPTARASATSTAAVGVDVRRPHPRRRLLSPGEAHRRPHRRHQRHRRRLRPHHRLQGRLPGAGDDRPAAAGAPVLRYPRPVGTAPSRARAFPSACRVAYSSEVCCHGPALHSRCSSLARQCI